MMGMKRNRWLWGIMGLAAGAMAVRNIRGNRQARKMAAQRSRTLWRRAAHSGRSVRPTALNMAARAGQAVVDTTVRTFRAISRV